MITEAIRVEPAPNRLEFLNRTASRRDPIMRRRLLGLISLALIVGGLIGMAFVPESNSALSLLPSAAIRSGCVLGALWLAFPRLAEFSSRVPGWLLAAYALGGLVIVVRRQAFPFIAPLLILLGIMHALGFFLGKKPR